MYNADGQYISVTKENTNLNVEYQKLKNKNIHSTNRSTFIINDNDFMGEDVLFKLQSLQKDVTHTYIASFIEDEKQFITPKDQVIEETFLTKKLNDEINISVSKNKIFETTHFFEKTGIDYILSPFSVLNEHNIQNPESNALIILIYNNKLYALIVDSYAKIIFSKVLTISGFDDVQNSEFYDDVVMKQNLYDEIYQLELTNHIKNIMAEFYESDFDIFVEKINILYTVKQLSREQITKIQNELMLKIDYHPISMDEVVFEMIRTKKIEDVNFITPRVKKADKNQSFLIIMAILIVIGAIVYIISFQTDIPNKKNIRIKDSNIKKVEKEKVTEEKKTIKIEVKLPNHIKKNTTVTNLTKNLLELIPYDMVLNKLEIKKDSSIMYGNIITKDLFAKSLKDDLLTIYENSEITFENEEKSSGEYKAIITNNIVKTKEIKDIKTTPYSNNIFLSRAQIDLILKNAFPNNSVIIFDSNFKSEMITFNYKISMKNTSPKLFFEAIDKLNKLSNSIHINYPIVFETKDTKLEISFNLQVHQYK